MSNQYQKLKKQHYLNLLRECARVVSIVGPVDKIKNMDRRKKVGGADEKLD